MPLRVSATVEGFVPVFHTVLPFAFCNLDLGSWEKEEVPGASEYFRRLFSPGCLGEASSSQVASESSSGAWGRGESPVPGAAQWTAALTPEQPWSSGYNTCARCSAKQEGLSASSAFQMDTMSRNGEVRTRKCQSSGAGTKSEPYREDGQRAELGRGCPGHLPPVSESLVQTWLPAAAHL